MGDSFISIPCPTINISGYSIRPLMDCTYNRDYFHSVESKQFHMHYFCNIIMPDFVVQLC